MAQGLNNTRSRLPSATGTLAFMLAAVLMVPQWAEAQADNSAPPQKTVKLIFIHHSCGENWLADDHGGLGKALARSNYFVSDTNYGWGPDNIGDRTDIPDWPEWFTGPSSARYLKALCAENRKHAPYTRTLSDPGGENQIIMFKSCFPNSDLEGRPSDPPRRGDGLTVSNAKAIYNELLTYFATRPDKLFIAITAPPVQDRTHSANARAFNNWLTHEWLANYKGNNVAVFDFYTVLTGPNNHHRFHEGKIEHAVQPGRNTLSYPSNGDDHPSSAGNRKAAAEFVPLLNVYYHRWQASARLAPRPETLPKTAPSPERPDKAVERAVPPTEPQPVAPSLPVKAEPVPQPAVSPPPIRAGGVIEDFERETGEWAAFLDEGKKTLLTFQRDPTQRQEGSASLRIAYDVASQSWATCSLVYQQPRDWRGARGLSLYLHAQRAGQPVVVVAYQGRSPEQLSSFEYRTETTQAAVGGWQRLEIPWERLAQPSWEGDGKAKFDPGSAMGVAFLFEGEEARRHRGELWVDAVSLVPR